MEKISLISIKIGIQLATSFYTLEPNENISILEMKIHHSITKPKLDFICLILQLT